MPDAVGQRDTVTDPVEAAVTRPETASRLEKLLPSLADVIFVGLTCIVVFAAPLLILSGDGDLASHIRLGEEILRSRGIPEYYAPTYTMEGTPFLAHAWLGEVVLALAHSAGGLAMNLVLAAVVIGLVFTIQFRFVVGGGAPVFAALGATALAAAATALHWLGRSHLFTWYLAIGLLALLENPRTRAWWLLPYFALWVNLHGGFLYGVMLVGIYAAGTAVETWLSCRSLPRTLATPKVRRMASFLAIAVLGTFINPAGPAHYADVLAHLGNPEVIDPIREFQSPDFHAALTKPFLISLLLVVGAAAWTARRMPLVWLLVLVVNTYYALYAARNIGLFMVVAWPLAVVWISRGWTGPSSRAAEDSVTLRKAREGPGWLSLLFALLLAGLAVNHGRVGGRQVIAAGFSPDVFPVEAVREARQAGLPGPIFNEMVWGGYVVYAWPEQRVYIDGLLYDGDLLQEYLDLSAARDEWRDALRSRDIRLALLPPSSVLAQQLLDEPGWGLWMCDGTAAVLARGQDAPGGRSGARRLAECRQDQEARRENPRFM